MHFHHRQTDTDIVAKARDVYITSHAINHQYKLSQASKSVCNRLPISDGTEQKQTATIFAIINCII